ncbi:MAG: hypothetical protein D6744_16165 [Planctomycetota bacterium]|nr:MAG: hypothetical protein D6744_16165 [Planctomycetota bacterium]
MGIVLLLGTSLPMLAGGCPLQSNVLAEQVSAASPGEYFVQAGDRGLIALPVAEARSATSEWIDLPADAAWFAGDGVYELSADGEWSLEQDVGGASFDAWLQTYDPVRPVDVDALLDAQQQLYDPAPPVSDG